ncbi:MAG: hypothetical protein HYR96_07265 [Deltaproteobacteria bacterium]|nr:hypothetical protein [Deltaproteobacteria bacterium]MBI3295140.1 hypothetical protein [Deltaproteobacteria bacterium]
MKKIFLILLVIASADSALALKRYYSISRSVRAHGMGDAFYGLSDDEYALFYNPAGLGVYRGGTQFLLSTRAGMTSDTPGSLGTLSSSFGGSKTATEVINSFLTLQNKPLGGNISFLPTFLKKKFAFGVVLPDVKVDFDVLGAGLDTSMDITAIADAGIVLSFAKTFLNDTLSVGLTPKFLARLGGTKNVSILEIVQGNSLNLDINSIGGYGAGLDFDIGATYRFDQIPYGLVNRASLVLSNLLASNFPLASSKATSSSVGVPGLVRMVSLGWYSAFKGVGIIDNFGVVADLAEIGIGGESDENRGARGGSLWKHLNLGVEAPIKGWFVPRAGLHQGNFTLGFGIRTIVLQLDYAFFGDELLGGVGRYTAYTHELRLGLGFGGYNPPPIAMVRPESMPTGFEAPKPEAPAEKPKTDEPAEKSSDKRP